MPTFKKNERLKSVKLIQQLFTDSQSKKIYNHPYILLYREIEGEQEAPARALFSVSSRKFKKAVVRNKLKRQIRELYRLNKEELYTNLNDNHRKIILAILYVAGEKYDFAMLRIGFEELMEKLMTRIKTP